jgi:NAD(P)-dependent dehydrogenase (short-subunit alcohol dehydrogenase family)
MTYPRFNLIDLNLNGRTALVTGASRNISQAVAETFAEAGADIGVTARRDEDSREETVAHIREAGGGASPRVVDQRSSGARGIGRKRDMRSVEE